MTLEEGLLLSAIAFVGTHVLLSHPLRTTFVRTLGEGPFRGIYSLVAIITFALMVYFYRAVGREPPLWDSGAAGWIVGTLLMWCASILFVGSFIKNPALVGARGPSGGPAGVMRITRHPMMWSFALWAAVHLMILATPKAIVLDGAIIILALGGAAAQDSKKGEVDGRGLARLDGADRLRSAHSGHRQSWLRRVHRGHVAVLRRDLAASDACRILALDRLKGLKRRR